MLATRQTFQLSPEQLTIRNILNKKNFVEIEIWAISNAKPNRNRSHFTVQSMEEGLDSFIDKPILGFFNTEGDFEQHNGKVSYDSELDQAFWDNKEQILGFIRQSDQREIVEKDGLTWIRCTAMIYTQYNFKQVKRLLKDKHKKVSVEIDVLKSEKIDGIEYIYSFVLSGITILGSKGGVPIREGIEGAHLSVLDLIEKRPEEYNKQKEALVFAYAELNNEEDNKLVQDDGTKVTFSVNKSTAALSNADWSVEDRAALRSRIVEDANFAELAKDVFLCLGEGWEAGDVSKLKYPVMQFTADNEVVYNRNGLASAKAYAEKTNNEEVLSKLKEIYTELGLDFAEEQTCDCSEFCDLYEDKEPKNDDDGEGDNGNDDKTDGAKSDDGEGTDNGENSENNDNHSEKHSEEQYKELELRCQDYEEKCGKYEAQCKDYEAKCADYEVKCKDYEAQMAECETKYTAVFTELEEYKSKEKARMAEAQIEHVNSMAAKMGLSAEDIKDITEKCHASAFSAVEDIDKEMAYLSWKKTYTEENQQVKKPEGYSVNIVENSTPVKSQENLSVGERLKRNLNK